MRLEATTYSHKEYKIEHYSLNWSVLLDEHYITGDATLTGMLYSRHSTHY